MVASVISLHLLNNSENVFRVGDMPFIIYVSALGLISNFNRSFRKFIAS